jgi:hypothetical protein
VGCAEGPKGLSVHYKEQLPETLDRKR